MPQLYTIKILFITVFLEVSNHRHTAETSGITLKYVPLTPVSLQKAESVHLINRKENINASLEAKGGRRGGLL